MEKTIVLFLLIILLAGTHVKAQYLKEIKVETILKSDTTSLGQCISYPAFQQDEVSMLRITIPSGKTTGWHKHEFPVFAYVLKGTLTVEFESGKTMKFNENSSFAEVINLVHRGINKEDGDLVLLAIYLGEKGKQLSIPVNPTFK